VKFRELLSRRFELSSVQLEQLERHYTLLVKWNSKLNLTRIKKMEEAIEFHYGESLFVADALPRVPLRIGDVGSGAGFPGIPLAVLLPESTVTLIEANGRKSTFLREASRGLPNVFIRSERAESIKCQFDWLTSRAVRPSDVLKLRLARDFAILTTEPNLLGLPPPASVIKYPSGNKRVLAMFHVEHDRIDETSE
jgi:16S rRNA (guanine527-N7)-methyltransferase